MWTKGIRSISSRWRIRWKSWICSRLRRRRQARCKQMPMRWWFARGLVVTIALGVWGDVSLAQAQVRPAAQPPPRGNPNPRRPNKPGAKAQANPAKELERFQKMSPEQRQKEMAKLPPAQRVRMQRL